LLGNGSVKTFPQQRRLVGSVVLYAVHVVSKESRRLVLPGTSYLESLLEEGFFCILDYVVVNGMMVDELKKA
jgi:hypothetical protein